MEKKKDDFQGTCGLHVRGRETGIKPKISSLRHPTPPKIVLPREVFFQKGVNGKERSRLNKGQIAIRSRVGFI